MVSLFSIQLKVNMGNTRSRYGGAEEIKTTL